MDEGSIIVKGARVNNLKNIDLQIPRGKLVVVTGISGSGKSSLAFDTLFAEGQRRFAQSLSSYARQFLGRMSKPDVDWIDGIPPAIAIEQKVSTKNPRSTVATTTEVYDFLRLVWARVGKTYSPVSGKEVHRDTVKDVADYVTSLLKQNREPGGPVAAVYITAPLNWGTRTDRTELLLSLKEQGYNRLWSEETPLRIDDALQNEPEDASLLLDRFRDASDRDRLLASIADAFRQGDGKLAVISESVESLSESEKTFTVRQFSTRFELDGMTFREPDDYLFSFNSPLGACPVCGGLGKIIGISEDLVVPDKTKSIYDGCFACWRGEKMGWFKDHLVQVAERYGIDIFTPYCKLPQSQKDIIWNGRSVEGDENSIVGLNEFFEWVETQRYKIQYKYMLGRFSGRTVCGECHGSRLRREALYVKVGGKTIAEALSMTVDEALAFWAELQGSCHLPDGTGYVDLNACNATGDILTETALCGNLTAKELELVKEPLQEILSRLHCIQDVGLGYLTLDRACNTLSGGESQRVNLVTALGSSLVGSMYILDEPSIGLHSRDTERLVSVLKRLRDIGNTIIVVEHDEDIINAADILIDMGPGAGVNGGKIIFQGRSSDATSSERARSLTLQYIFEDRPRYRRERREWQYSICVEGAMEHNLKGIDVRFPLGVLTVVTGVSGSGKSSLVGDILYPALFRKLNESGNLPGTHRGLSGNIDRIDRVEYVDQNPIGRSARSNAVTYLKVYDLIRKLLSDQQYARMNGYGPSTFSFNQDGGRCPECQGDGVVRIEMQFMADVTMTCEECGGKRFKADVLEVRYRGKNVDDILNMSVEEAIAFFAEGDEPEAKETAERLKPLMDVGLGYVKLGQSSSTFSGGESQRIKLAYFLSMKDREKKSEKILFVFDEPTTGLHFHDVEKLLKAFDSLLAAGHSLVVVEHNTDVIHSADWVIDLGPDAGENGGRVVFEGTPEDLAKADTFTAKYLKSANISPSGGVTRDS